MFKIANREQKNRELSKGWQKPLLLGQEDSTPHIGAGENRKGRTEAPPSSKGIALIGKRQTMLLDEAFKLTFLLLVQLPEFDTTPPQRHWNEIGKDSFHFNVTNVFHWQ